MQPTSSYSKKVSGIEITMHVSVKVSIVSFSGIKSATRFDSATWFTLSYSINSQRIFTLQGWVTSVWTRTDTDH